MQQFTVPQFIDVEDKIIGPITTRQFVIMLVCALLIAGGYRLFDFSLWVVYSLLLFGISGTIAFLRISGMPFHFFILNFTQTALRPGKRIWNKSDKDLEVDMKIETGKSTKKEEDTPRDFVSNSRLSELSLIVDTQGVYKGEEESTQFKPNKNLKKNNK